MNGVLVAGAVAAVFAARGALEPYRLTSHGHNPWSAEALGNVLLLKKHMDAARELVSGRFSSVYRSQRVNKKVGGAKTSRHLAGLAADIVPGKSFSPEQASRAIQKAAEEGKLGPVSKVIWEPGWVHVSWKRPAEVVTAVALIRKTKAGFERLTA